MRVQIFGIFSLYPGCAAWRWQHPISFHFPILLVAGNNVVAVTILQTHYFTINCAEEDMQILILEKL